MFWDEVGHEVWRFVKNSFEQGHFDPSVAKAQLVLIPKGDIQSSFKDFRPISLCNVLYKIISKVLVAHLRPFLSDLVSPHQSSFIPGKGTVDNAIVLQEIVYTMARSKKKKGDLVYKLDLEKAYDRVDWRFLQTTLQRYGFPLSGVHYSLDHVWYVPVLFCALYRKSGGDYHSRGAAKKMDAD